MNKHYYHISTKGTSADLFLDEEDFRQVILIMAQVFNEEPGTIIVAYCIMYNHIHIVVYGQLEVIEKQLIKLKKLYSMWYAKKYKVSKVLARVPHKIRLCEDLEDVKRCIAYDYMNPVRAKLANNAFNYPWSSISAHFREDKYKFMYPSTEVRQRGARDVYHTRQPIPSCLRVMPNGHFDSASVIRPEYADRILKSPRSLDYLLYANRDASSNAKETQFLSNDETVINTAREFVRGLCGKDLPLNTLPDDLMKRVIEYLRLHHGTPLSVIRRVFRVEGGGRSGRP